MYANLLCGLLCVKIVYPDKRIKFFTIPGTLPIGMDCFMLLAVLLNFRSRLWGIPAAGY